MTEQITLEEALKLVEFEFVAGAWRVEHVKTNVYGTVWCNVYGDVDGDVRGDVIGDVLGCVYGKVGGYVGGSVQGTINGRKWEYTETPKEKLKRLVEKGADKAQLLEAINQLEDN